MPSLASSEEASADKRPEARVRENGGELWRAGRGERRIDGGREGMEGGREGGRKRMFVRERAREGPTFSCSYINSST